MGSHTQHMTEKISHLTKASAYVEIACWVNPKVAEGSCCIFKSGIKQGLENWDIPDNYILIVRINFTRLELQRQKL